MVLETTANAGTVSLAMKMAGFLHRGRGYTSTEYMTVSVSGVQSEKRVIENWENFEAADEYPVCSVQKGLLQQSGQRPCMMVQMIRNHRLDKPVRMIIPLMHA